MSYIKSLLPDDWELEKIIEQESNAKYLCLGNKNVEPEWLYRWYGVSFDECVFSREDKQWPAEFNDWPGIVLRPLPKGSDYKQHLKILKTERLLNGARIY